MDLRAPFRKDPTLKRALAWGLAAGLLTAAFTLTLPNQYTSEILVLPKSAGGGGPLAAFSAATGLAGGGGLTGIMEDGYHIDIVDSRWLAERMLDTEFGFTYRTWYFGELQTRKETLAVFMKADSPRKREAACKKLHSWLAATRDLKTGVLRIRAEAPSPELAQHLANRATDLLELALKTRIQTQGTAKADYAKARLIRAQQEEDQARKALVAFTEAHRNVGVSPDPAVRAQGQELGATLALRQQITTTITLGLEQAELDARSTLPMLSRLDEAYLPANKSGPQRANLVLAAVAAVAGLYYLWMNRARLQGSIKAIEAARSLRPGT